MDSALAFTGHATAGANLAVPSSRGYGWGRNPTARGTAGPMSDETLDSHGPETRPRAGYSVAARISREIVKLISSYTGRGPTKARTTLNANFATVLLEDTLTRAEHNLVAAGEHESVRRQRAILNRLMREDAVATVERATGRRVRAYLTDVAPESDVAMVVFVFDQRLETGEVSVAEAEGDAPSDAS
jgi:uncharacterized protein YbcI